MGAEAGAALLRRYARSAGDGAFRLIESLAAMGTHPTAQLAAVEALGDVPLQGAADLADRWTADSAPKALRKAARRALLRLAQRGIRPAAQSAPADAAAPAARPEHVRRAAMSAVNGEGTRLLYLLIDVPVGPAQLGMAVVSQAHGLTRFETSGSSARQFERAVQEDERRYGFALVDIPAAYARLLLAEAVDVTRAAGRGLPQRYHSFRELLAPAETETDGAAGAEARSPVYDLPEIDAVRYHPEPPEASIALLDRSEFADWAPEQDQVRPLAAEWEAAEGGTLMLPPAAVAQRREATMDRLIELVLGPGGASGFRRRLEDNAYVLIKRGAAAGTSGAADSRDGRRALAAALALEPADLAVARLHPLVRSLAARALDQARAALEEEATRANPYGLITPRAGASPAGAAPEPGDEAAGPAQPSVRPSGLILPR